MNNFSLKSILSPLADKGFETILCGLEAISFYKNKSSEMQSFNIQTDASITDLGYLWEDIEYSVNPSIDCRIIRDNVCINFCNSLPNNKNIFIQLKKIAKDSNVPVLSLFYSPLKDVFYDPLNVYSDIKANRIVINEETKLSPVSLAEILHLIFNHNFLIGKDSHSRIESIRLSSFPDAGDVKYILRLILTCREPYEPLKIAHSSGLLEMCIPELSELKDVFQDKEHHPEGDVFTHTIECFRHLSSPDITLAMATLMHDVAKPCTATMDINRRFPGHASIGAVKAAGIMTRLGFAEKTIKNVEFLIKNHLLSREIARRDEKQRLELMQHELFPKLLKLYKADINGCFGKLDPYYRIVAMYNKESRINKGIK